MTNIAFEITADDVANVMRLHGQEINEASAQRVFDDVIADEVSRIEKAALYGNDLDQQTNYAYQEIASVLREAGVLHPGT